MKGILPIMKTNDFYRPKYHYSAKCGWINDPNGFSVYKNKYHLFAQHNPKATEWGPMHWSHAISDDLISWEHLPIALTPSEDYEIDLGCFSGTAIEHDGKHILMYTGSKGKIGEPCQQEQCIAIGDGVNYNKCELNPVITAKNLPDFVKNSDFRDPKIFKHNGVFYALMGAMVHEKNIGTMLLYKSNNLSDWEYVGETLRAPEDGSMGIVFECPDIFKIDGKHVILTSPINMPKQGYKYANISSSVYFVGDMDFNTGKFSVDYYDEIDTGFDFYAPQSTVNKKGETVMIAWAQMWERNFVTHELSHGWAGAMTIPRKLSLIDGKLIQTPVEELETYHKENFSSLNEGSQNLYRLIMDIDLSLGSKFELELLKTTAGSFMVKYDKVSNSLIIDRGKSLFKLDKHPKEVNVNNVRRVELNSTKQLRLDIIVDKSIIEIFVNKGEHALTSNYYISSGEICTAINTDYNYVINKYNM